MPAGPKNALAAWGRSALRPVLLPSGMKALVKLPDAAELIRNESFPQELRTLAAKYSAGGIEIAKLEPDEIGHFLRLTYELVARAVKYLALPGSEAWDLFLREGGDPSAEGWEPVTLDASFFAGEGDVDQGDVEALAKIVGRQTTPNEVTLASRLDLGLIHAPEEVPDDLDPDEGGRVSDHATFREQPGGALDRARGEDVRDATVRAPRGGGSGSRARRR